MSVMEETPVMSRRSFTDEFKRDPVALVLDEDRKIAGVARSLGGRQARIDRGERAGLSTSEKAELGVAAQRERSVAYGA